MGNRNSLSRRDRQMSNHEKQLHLAIMGNQRLLVRALIDEQVDVNCRWRNTNCPLIKDGATPLLCSVLQNRINITKILIGADACVNKPDLNGCTPLFKAAFHGRPQLIELLIKSGARVNLENRQGQTPLYICVYNSIVHSNTDAVRCLLKAHANVDKCDYDGVTPMHVSCQWKRPQMLSMLINSGGDVNVVDKYGRTPLYVCASSISTRLFDADLALILPCLRILHAAGADMLNLVEHLQSKGGGIPNSVLFSVYADTDNATTVGMFADWYKLQASRPLSLSILCRKVIQHRIHHDDVFVGDTGKLPLLKDATLVDDISKLPLPRYVRKIACRKLFPYRSGPSGPSSPRSQSLHCV